MKQQLVIPIALPSLNEIINLSKTHWSQYARPKKGYDVIVTAFSKKQMTKVTKYPVDILCKWKVKDKRKDPDNISVGIKFILDGLVKAGIISNDGFDEINSIHHTFIVDKDNVGVEITLTY